MRRLMLGVFLCLTVLVLTAQAGVQLPDELKAVPLYPGGEVQQTMNTGEGVFALVGVPGKPEHGQVLEFFKKHFVGEGWTMVLELNEEQGGALSYAKDGRQVMITVDGSGEETGYTIILAKQQ